MSDRPDNFFFVKFSYIKFYDNPFRCLYAYKQMEGRGSFNRSSAEMRNLVEW
jgi:hypothetical protein